MAACSLDDAGRDGPACGQGLVALLAGPRRNAELRRRLPGITQKVLTETLRSMEADGLAQRRVLRYLP